MNSVELLEPDQRWLRAIPLMRWSDATTDTEVDPAGVDFLEENASDWSAIIYGDALWDDEVDFVVDDLTERFLRLKAEWKSRTAHLSSLADKFSDPAYLQIVAMGEKALPLIIEDLRRMPDHWFAALFAIAGEQVIKEEHRGSLSLMARDWINWGERRGVA